MLGNDASTLNINGWTLTAGTAGTFNPSTTRFPDEAPQGQNTAFTNGPNISQVIPEILAEDTVYSLLVEVGDRADAGFSGYTVDCLLEQMSWDWITIASPRPTADS